MIPTSSRAVFCSHDEVSSGTAQANADAPLVAAPPTPQRQCALAASRPSQTASTGHVQGTPSVSQTDLHRDAGGSLPVAWGHSVGCSASTNFRSSTPSISCPFPCSSCPNPPRPQAACAYGQPLHSQGHIALNPLHDQPASLATSQTAAFCLRLRVVSSISVIALMEQLCSARISFNRLLCGLLVVAASDGSRTGPRANSTGAFR